MKRREFLNAALAGMAAMTLVPVLPATKAVPFEEVFQPAGDWAEVHPDGKTVTTLDGIFKRAYAGKVQACYPTPLTLMAEPGEIHEFRVKLLHENGFTNAT